jgi:hypothetical protein
VCPLRIFLGILMTPAWVIPRVSLALVSAIGLFGSLIYSVFAADLSGLTYDDRRNIETACILSRSSGPAAYNQCVSHYVAELRQSPSSSVNNKPSPGNTTQAARSSVPAPSAAYPLAPALPAPPYPAPMCAENGSCYGDISNITGLPKTTHVNGYFRSDGTYVRGYYRSHR